MSEFSFNSEIKHEKTIYRLESLCRAESSNIALKDIDEVEGQYELYGASGFIQKISHYKQDKDYIAIVKDGAGVGRTMMLPAFSTILGTMQYIIPNDNINPKYLYYAIKRLNLSRYKTGATIPHIYFRDYKNERIAVYDIPIQDKIVEVLDQVNSLLNKVILLIENLDLLSKSLFNDKIINAYEIRIIKDLVDLNISSMKRDNKDISYIDISCIDNENNIINSYLKIKSEDAPSRAKSVLVHNDILISTVRPNLKNVAIYNLDLLNPVASSGFCVLRAKSVEPSYLFESIKSESFTNKMVMQTTGANYPAIKNNDIYNFEIPIVSYKEQLKFSAIISQIDKSKSVLKKQLEELEILNKALMQKYFG